MSSTQGKDRKQIQALFKDCVTEKDLDDLFDELALDSLRLRYLWTMAWGDFSLDEYRQNIDQLRGER